MSKRSTRRTDAPAADHVYDPITVGRLDTPGPVAVGGGLVLPLAYRRMSAQRQALVRQLQAAAVRVHEAQADLDEAVWRCRDAQVSWDVVAWSTGLSPRGASKRWQER